VIFISLFFIASAHAGSFNGAFEGAHMREKIEETRASISEAERKQRESLSNLFVINKNIREIARKRAKLNEKMLAQEARVREAAQEFREMEERSERHKVNLNHRLRQLYQGRNQDTIHWIFSAKSPVDFERNHRFLKRMVDADHKQLKIYLLQLKELRQKREQLKGLVAGLSRMQKDIQAEESQLSAQMKQKSRHVAELRRMKDSKLSELKDLRVHLPSEGDFAFFERKGTLPPPVDAPLKREYGTYVDPQFRFRLMHKGMFFAAKANSPVTCIAEGTVVLAGSLPGYGKSVIVDHGDNYYSVYAFAAQLRVKEGARIKEGETLALAGGRSPLFGPGLYFEIRHFTDAIDPRGWIKEPIIKTAKRSTSWDDVSGIAGP
jgi:septal ring factor EnvC (AmiA/AmiB activator)